MIRAVLTTSFENQTADCDRLDIVSTGASPRTILPITLFEGLQE